jgi:Rps23 Pro-64 3,4-dihydroxylase Tpa1-like proline 4-hydroxylase
MIKKYSDPFPHIIIENFLDIEECSNIISDINLNLKNLKSNLVMGGRKRIFSNFLKKNTSSYRFYNSLNTLAKFNFFFKTLMKINKLSKNKTNTNLIFDKIENKRANSIFNSLKKKMLPFMLKKKVFLEMDFSKAKKGYHREPHHDAPNKIMAFLIYLNDIKNKKEGGSLEIYKYKKKENQYLQKPNFNKLKLVKKIYPKKGTMIIFLSSPFSVHGVEKYNPIKKNLRYFIYGSYGSYFNIDWKN